MTIVKSIILELKALPSSNFAHKETEAPPEVARLGGANQCVPEPGHPREAPCGRDPIPDSC